MGLFHFSTASNLTHKFFWYVREFHSLFLFSHIIFIDIILYAFLSVFFSSHSHEKNYISLHFIWFFFSSVNYTAISLKFIRSFILFHFLNKNLVRCCIERISLSLLLIFFSSVIVIVVAVVVIGIFRIIILLQSLLFSAVYLLLNEL